MKKLLSTVYICLPLTLTLPAVAGEKDEVMPLKIGSFSKEYLVKKPVPQAEVKIFYVYDFVDNLDLIQASATQLVDKLKSSGMDKQIEAVVVPGDKANALGAILAQELRKSNPDLTLSILRNSDKAGSVHKVSYKSITSPETKAMHMRPDHAVSLAGKKVLILDDVISTGATVKAAKELVEKAGGKVMAVACVATEDMEDPSQKGPLKFEGVPLLRLTHFPVIPVK